MRVESPIQRRTPGVRHRVPAPFLAVLLTAFLAPPLAAMHPNHPLDNDPEQPVQGFAEGIDNIDLYSGALSLRIPIGPFTLNYSSSVWRYDVDEKGEITANPHRYNNAGLGFHLGWGEVLSRHHNANPTDKWLYTGNDGGQHLFYDTLHHLEPNVAQDVHYSRDNSYLRLREQDDTPGIHRWVEIESPDGKTQRFECFPPPGQGCGFESIYRLHKEWSPFSSRENPDFEVTYDNFNAAGNPELWTITDRYGLTHRVHLSGEGPWIILRVTKVEIQSFGGQTATYDFHYQTPNIWRSCKDSSGETGPTVAVPLLVQIDLPDGSNYNMLSPSGTGEPLYHTTCDVGPDRVDDVSGLIKAIFLPTGGEIAWGWRENEFPPGETNGAFYTSAGVKARVLAKPNAAGGFDVVGVWKYKSTSIGRGDPPLTVEDDPQIITEVVYPTGDCSKHFFDARYYIHNPTGHGWELGLPFVYTDQVDNKFLSTQLWDSNDGAEGCAGQKVQSTYVRFRHDIVPGTGNQEDFYNTNRQLEASRTIFHLDDLDAAGQERYTNVEKTEFDGLGHFRRTVETGNFRDDSLTAERRETFVGFNRSTGTYPGTYVPVPPTAPWVLSVFDQSQVTEPDAHGVTTSKTEFGFEDATGFLTCTRLLANGISRGTTDLLAVRAHGTLGNVTAIKRYGGDQYPGHNTPLPTTGGGCGDIPSQPDTWLAFAYDPLSGAHVATRPLTPSGNPGPFLTYDVDVEPATGFVIRKRDPALVQVTYDYDASGRVKSATPQAGAQALYTYDNRTAVTPATFTSRFVAPGTGEVLSERNVLLDDFARPFLDRRRLPGANVWTEQETVRNGRGWVTSVSEWGDLTQKTEYREYDALGRPEVIRPPDGGAHDLRISRLGSRRVTQEVKRALAGGEAYVPKVLESDRYGRLRKVEEPSGAAGAMTTTTYRYDVAGRLTEVRMQEAAPSRPNGIGPGGIKEEKPSSVSQTRSFTYDGRGFLLSETHPEKGVNGNGTVTYHDFDASGLGHRMVDGPNSLAFVYDFMGRLLQTLDLNRPPSSQLLTKLDWDGAGGLGVGKLWKADRYNYVDLVWNAQGEEKVTVRQVFGYSGPGGAISEKVTRTLWSSDDVRFLQQFTYDDLGAIKTATYPYCTQPAACTGSEVATSRKIVYTRDKGFLTGVAEYTNPGSMTQTPWAGPITYHPSGLRKELPHSNGVIDHLVADDHWTQRTQQIFTSGASPGFDSGVMSYDGAGNLKALDREIAPGTIVTDAFTYDRVGRLVAASYLDGTFGPSFSYDSFGNLQSVQGISGGMVTATTDSATNRIQGSDYDGAGNMLSSPLIPWQFSYDTSNRLTGQAGRYYLYDAFGERAVTIANILEEAASFHVRDLDHRLVSEVTMNAGSWSRNRDFIFADGALLGRTDGQGHQLHFHLDHLGSTRLVTEPDGTTLSEMLYMPYGGENFTMSEDARFTGHERDASTGADYMHARHYRSDIGRFLSVDPLLGSVSLPQSWNRYAYVMGNPLNLADPTGEAPPCLAGDLGDSGDIGVCQGTPGFIDFIDVIGLLHPDNGSTVNSSIPGLSCRAASCSPFDNPVLIPTGQGDTPVLDIDLFDEIDVVADEPTPEEVKDQIDMDMLLNPPSAFDQILGFDAIAKLPRCSSISSFTDSLANNPNFAGNRVQERLGLAASFLPGGGAMVKVAGGAKLAQATTFGASVRKLGTSGAFGVGKAANGQRPGLPPQQGCRP